MVTKFSLQVCLNFSLLYNLYSCRGIIKEAGNYHYDAQECEAAASYLVVHNCKHEAKFCIVSISPNAFTYTLQIFGYHVDCDL